MLIKCKSLVGRTYEIGNVEPTDKVAKLKSLLTEQIAERVHNASFAPREPSRARLAEFARLVTHSRLLDRDDVVLTPHVAYNSVEAKACMRDVVIANIRRHLSGEPLKYLCP